jgi:trehalose utilization protein
MNAVITKQSSTVYGQYFTINVEGAEIFVSVYTDGRVNVCAMNAMARLHRGLGGRIFQCADEALSAYKSEKVRTAIALAITCAPDFAKLQSQN